MDKTDILRLERISFAYPHQPDALVLDRVDFALAPGDRIGIVGPNGAGKSTLLKIAMGLLRPSSGAVHALGRPRAGEKDFPEVRRAVGYLFQDPDDQLFCPTVLEDVAFGPLNLGKGGREARAVASRVLHSLGLAGYEHKITYRLSGGEKRLVSLAAVLAMEPRALLLDEPSTGIDDEHLGRLERVLLDSLDPGMAWAIVSHDRAFLRRTCRVCLVLDHGRLRPA